MSCLTCNKQSVWLHNIMLTVLARHQQTHLPGRLIYLADSLAWRHSRQYFFTKPSPCMCSTSAVGNTVEKPAENQTSIGLACHLVRVANSWSGGYEFVFPAMTELGALNEGGKTLGVRSSYSGDPDVIMSCLTCTVANILSGCITLAVWHATGRLTRLEDSLAWLNQAHVQHLRSREHCREACWDSD
jgi:hypothetical protein